VVCAEAVTMGDGGVLDRAIRCGNGFGARDGGGEEIPGKPGSRRM